ncbi:DUF1240 domain-containing protein [Pectobacterium wasabiae]|uniref:Membrane protein n=1 Tax=Pectobacterium wasabiae TaxID=55208 RepID=A0AAW3ELE7_9GAMM|nr:DUF1240 domain-containing protein [Pectobacterium wasabiae]AOR62320.1 hypothetical protein A7983_03360 [Pectobacterium wasabiae CFBP 3304]KFX06363.1 membrane protein [Pectobacterium wasabiae]KGA28198.1 membrane protein [Pectobacterium wasabiae]
MVKINRPLIGSFALFLFLASCWGCWFSLSGYFAFFESNDVIIFSWKVGVLIFAVPLLFYFSYLAFYSAIKNEPAKMNNELANVLAMIAIFGAVVSLFLSIYVSYNLNIQSYKTCPKISWMDPSKYVKDISLCKE